VTAGGPAGDPDDLRGVTTPMSRFLDRARGALGVVLAIALVVPLGAGLLQALVFSRAGDRVVDDLTAADLDASLGASVVLVGGTTCTAGGAVTGTAFAATVDGRDVLLTNAHVVDDVGSVGVRPLDGGPGIAVASWRPSRTADVALLELEDPDRLPPTLELAAATPGPGTPVRTVGFPSGLPYTAAGEVADLAPGRLELDVRVDPGASGSPVLDRTGVVVGQVFARTGEGRGVATPVGTLRTALDDLADPRSGC
jgi:S1-C subfamily serine protease